MPDRKFLLSRMLRLQGVITILVGLTWLVAESQGRLAGVMWLKVIFEWTGLPLDTIFGVGWIISGIGMSIGGWFGCRSPGWETAGYLAGLCWPLFVGVIFGLAWAQGYTPTGYVTLISYLNFAAFYLVYLLRNPESGAVIDRTSVDAEGD